MRTVRPERNPKYSGPECVRQQLRMGRTRRRAAFLSGANCSAARSRPSAQREKRTALQFAGKQAKRRQQRVVEDDAEVEQDARRPRTISRWRVETGPCVNEKQQGRNDPFAVMNQLRYHGNLPCSRGTFTIRQAFPRPERSVRCVKKWLRVARAGYRPTRSSYAPYVHPQRWRCEVDHS